MRRTRLVLLALCSAVLVAACGPKEPLRLGFVGGLSGRVADLGEAGRDGFQFAIEQANATGGVQGRRVEFVVKDDAQDPAQARKAVEELVAAGVVAIVGPMTSAMAQPVLEIATAAGIPVVSPTVTTTELTGKDDFFLRVSADTRSWLGEFRTAFAALGGNMAGEIAFESGDGTDHAALVGEMLATQPDALLVVAGALDTARIAQQVRQVDAGITLIGVDWAATERLVELGGKAVDGIFLTQFFDRDDPSPEYRGFRSAFESRFQRPPGFASVAAYDATKAILDAIWRAKSSTPVKTALIDHGPFAGAQQAVRFDRFGDSVRKAFIITIRDGQFLVID
jgi:branched-chain amino acid transport system substrate-binding protein